MCAVCGKAGIGPVWVKLKVWRQDKHTWVKESAPVCAGCSRTKA